MTHDITKETAPSDPGVAWEKGWNAHVKHAEMHQQAGVAVPADVREWAQRIAESADKYVATAPQPGATSAARWILSLPSGAQAEPQPDALTELEFGTLDRIQEFLDSLLLNAEDSDEREDLRTMLKRLRGEG